jgi:hypothetical protein
LAVSTMWIAQGMDGWRNRAVVFNVLDTLVLLFSTKVPLEVKNEWLSLGALTALTRAIVSSCFVNAPARGGAMAEQACALKVLSRVAQWHPDLWRQSLLGGDDGEQDLSNAFVVFEGIVGGCIRPVLAQAGRGGHGLSRKCSSGQANELRSARDELLEVALDTLSGLAEFWPDECLSSFDRLAVRVCDAVLGGEPLNSAAVPRSPTRSNSATAFTRPCTDGPTARAASALLMSVFARQNTSDDIVQGVADVVTSVFNRCHADNADVTIPVEVLKMSMELMSQCPAVLNVEQVSTAWLDGLTQVGCIGAFAGVWERNLMNLGGSTPATRVIQIVLPKALTVAMRAGEPEIEIQVVEEAIELGVKVGLSVSVNGTDGRLDQCMSVAVGLLLAVATRPGELAVDELARGKARAGLLALAKRAPEGFKRRVGELDAGTRSLLQQEVGRAMKEAS